MTKNEPSVRGLTMDTRYETTYTKAKNTINIRRQKYVKVGDEWKPDGLPGRIAVKPGDFEKVQAFAPDVLPDIQEIWTDEVIEAYKERARRMEAVKLAAKTAAETQVVT